MQSFSQQHTERNEMIACAAIRRMRVLWFLLFRRWLIIAAAVIVLLSSHAASAQVYATGMVYKAADGNSYIISNLQIGAGEGPTGRVTFVVIAVECGAPFDANPGWQMSFLSEQRQLLKLFSRGEPLTGITIFNSINNYMIEHSEIPVSRFSTAPGIVLAFYNFEIHCFPTSDDAKPATARLRLFDITDKWDVNETFRGDWVQLPNIKKLVTDGSASATEGIITFATGHENTARSNHH